MTEDNVAEPSTAVSPPTTSINTESLTPNGRRLMGLIEFDDKEQLVCEINKHPFGLWLIFVGGSTITLTLLVISIVLAAWLPSSIEGVYNNASALAPAIIGIGGLLSLLTVTVTFLGAYIYRSSVIIVTSQKIAQLQQHNIIKREISQLSIGDVQDINITQPDIFSRLFHYGTLTIETSGEQDNYTFTYVPDPYQRSKDIIGAHERDVQLHGN